MPGRKKDKTPPADTEAAAVLEAIDHMFKAGTFPAEKCPLDPAIRQQLDEIIFDLLTTQQFALAMSRGDLSTDLAARGSLAGSLKALQANLRHLTWQAGQIAKGDYSQQVQFMGDFATSFNAMTAHLAQNKIERDLQEQKLAAANAELAKEVVEYQRLQRALNLTNRKLSLLSSVTRHDIRNKLLALGAYIDLIRNAPCGPGALDEYLNAEEKILATIISQIQFAKDYEELGVKEPVWNNLEAIISEGIPYLSFREVKVVIDTRGAEVFADLLISKVFYNLMDNALRYGGPAMTEIRITAEEGSGGLDILVQDNGAGISGADREKLFTRGFGKNTGFGLFLSKEILSLTGITITEEGAPGSGARFRITVPKGEYRFR